MRAQSERIHAESAPATAMLCRYHAIRAHTLALIEPLSAEDCCVQSMPDASPLKWHAAHTSWFFETFILERFESGFRPFHPAFRVLFNSYYNGVGEKHARPQRGLLTRPSLQEVIDYRHDVDRRIAALLSLPETDDELMPLVELGLHHEQQHQELMLTDLKYLLSMNPMKPAYRSSMPAPHAGPTASEWVDFDARIVEIGHAGDGFCFDNETPRHREFVEPFAIASRLVSNAEYLEFVETGGYGDPAWWLSEGWDLVCANRLRYPLYWQRDDGETGWQEFTLHGLQKLDMHRAAMHLSYYEADAYARWAGARLPTETEWEHAAGDGRIRQLYDHAWQWTASSYTAYPGYRPAEGAIGEYNGKFMVNQYVLRGSSRATSPQHARRTYRNFFPATARWQFTGLRLAQSRVRR